MAIDTKEKRLSMLNFAFGTFVPLTLFESDDHVNMDDKYHALGLYSGFGRTSVIAPRIEEGGFSKAGFRAGGVSIAGPRAGQEVR